MRRGVRAKFLKPHLSHGRMPPLGACLHFESPSRRPILIADKFPLQQNGEFRPISAPRRMASLFAAPAADFGGRRIPTSPLSAPGLSSLATGQSGMARSAVREHALKAHLARLLEYRGAERRRSALCQSTSPAASCGRLAAVLGDPYHRAPADRTHARVTVPRR